MFIETAGGVLSPAPSCSTQADLYSKLRLPVILIADSKLGGISQTICAYESLRLRGYEIELVLLFYGTDGTNATFLRDYFSSNGPVEVKWIPSPPAPGGFMDEENMTAYYEKMASSETIVDAVGLLKIRHDYRIRRLNQMAGQAREKIWWPFTQHQGLEDKDIAVIDSARGDYFQILGNDKDGGGIGLLKSSFDGSASWWTQGLEHGNPYYALASAYAQGRYGHVIFPKAIHEPALSLAEGMLRNLQNPRLARAFFSDNGSTGVEVAIKMALRATRRRYGWGTDEPLRILGLKGSYHGDTIGAMNCSEPGIFNAAVEWYDGDKGAWLDYPSVLCTQGKWMICLPSVFDSIPCCHGPDDREYWNLFDLFDMDTRLKHSNLILLYESYITKKLTDFRRAGIRFGALMLEPVVLGAGGMILIDPLFQRILVDIVRREWKHFPKKDPATLTPTEYNPVSFTDWSGLPVIFDEVFTGMFRLGRFSSAYFLGTPPDISVHAKLLTGGLMPLCVTMASNHIFEAFKGENKTDALLHGHSYTAHPAACQVANESIRDMFRMNEGLWNWAKYENGWKNPMCTYDPGLNNPNPFRPGEAWSFWGAKFVETLSRMPVKGVWALGSVLAVDFGDRYGMAQWVSEGLTAGYPIEHKDGQWSGWNVHTRILGEVLYIISSLATQKATIKRIQELLEIVVQDGYNAPDESSEGVEEGA